MKAQSIDNDNFLADADGEAAYRNEDKRINRKKKRNSALLLIFNLLVIAVIVLVEVTGNNQSADINEALFAWGKNWQYLIALFVFVAIYYLCLAAKLNALIFSATGKGAFKLAFSTAVLGKYYDNVTPFGSGGQPFMMFNLGKKLDVGLATSIPVADFIVNQLTFTVLAIVVFAVNPSVMADNGFLRVAAYVGACFYALPPLAAIAFSVFPRSIRSVAKFFCVVGRRLKLIKNLDGALSKVAVAVDRYVSSIRLVSNRGNLLLNAFLSAIGWLVLNSLPFFVLRSFGVAADFFDTVCMSFFVYAAITVVPTPGNAGAAEGAFYVIFQSLSGGFLFWGTMLWRLCTYYISLISGLAVTVYQYAKSSRERI